MLRHWTSWRLAEHQQRFLALVVAIVFAIHPVSGILFLALGLSAYKFLQPSLVAALFLFFIAYVGFSTIHLNTTWRTGETLWSHSLNYGARAFGSWLQVSCA